jgi:hypothetical protein
MINDLPSTLRRAGHEQAMRLVLGAVHATPKAQLSKLAATALKHLDRVLAIDSARPGTPEPYLEGMQDIAAALSAIAQPDDRAR